MSMPSLEEAEKLISKVAELLSSTTPESIRFKEQSKKYNKIILKTHFFIITLAGEDVLKNYIYENIPMTKVEELMLLKYIEYCHSYDEKYTKYKRPDDVNNLWIEMLMINANTIVTGSSLFRKLKEDINTPIINQYNPLWEVSKRLGKNSNDCYKDVLKGLWIEKQSVKETHLTYRKSWQPKQWYAFETLGLPGENFMILRQVLSPIDLKFKQPLKRVNDIMNGNKTMDSLPINRKKKKLSDDSITQNIINNNSTHIDANNSSENNQHGLTGSSNSNGSITSGPVIKGNDQLSAYSKIQFEIDRLDRLQALALEFEGPEKSMEYRRQQYELLKKFKLLEQEVYDMPSNILLDSNGVRVSRK